MSNTNQVIVETLARINALLASDANAITTTRSGCVAPEQAQIELIREVLALAL